MAKHDKTDLGISTSLNPVPVVMISSSSDKGERNICTVAWAGTINSEPPMVSISLRKSRLSHEMISESGEFVINLVNKALAKSCDFCGVRSGRDVDKFSKCGLNSYTAKGLEKAVAITESPLSLSCKVKDVIELGSHDMFLAEVVAVTCDSYLMDDNGKVCLDKAGLVAYNHGEYFLLGEKLGFFGYSVAAPEVLERRMKDKS
jgi:flavin reductase (DIM6/NTAB) family NADH-FMN oxidoreductase RutF